MKHLPNPVIGQFTGKPTCNTCGRRLMRRTPQQRRTTVNTMRPSFWSHTRWFE